MLTWKLILSQLPPLKSLVALNNCEIRAFNRATFQWRSDYIAYSEGRKRGTTRAAIRKGGKKHGVIKGTSGISRLLGGGKIAVRPGRR